ncbi:TetR/AcrR family transcriptional regulator [Agrobacterium vitis]|uniref:TetR family transcriptional regulator n=1 Tax=Agrobacterium vitis TaxID=373 RepID=UPI001F410EEE|nr:TetR family transcriptional regulator [Agrobacterium vitis]MCF1465395.1 TetR/AcrR family transcriptional regulator [Agrobacterium vitis]
MIRFLTPCFIWVYYFALIKTEHPSNRAVTCGPHDVEIILGQDGMVTAMKMPNESSRINPRKQPKQKRSIQRVENILSSAEFLIIKHGVSQLRMTDIAANAGVPVGSVYQFFPQKAAVLKAIMDMRLTSLAEDITMRLMDVRDEADARARLVDLIESGARLHRDNPLCREFWIAMSTDPDLGALQYRAQEDIGALAMRWLGPFADGGDGQGKHNRFLLVAVLSGAVFRAIAEKHERAWAMLDEWKNAACAMLFQPAQK